MNKEHFVALIVLVILLTGGLSIHGATIGEEKKVIKTYPFSEPDPVPVLTRSSLWGRSSRLYPYSFFDKFSHTGIDKTWKVVRMENPYIEVFVLPEVGGKVYGAIEKSTKNEFIYLNHVIKFREIALRGLGLPAVLSSSVNYKRFWSDRIIDDCGFYGNYRTGVLK